MKDLSGLIDIVNTNDLNESFFLKVVDWYKKEYKISSYVKELIFTDQLDSSGFIFAKYSIENKAIYLDLASCKEITKQYLEIHPSLTEKEKNKLFKYLIVQILLHELTHAKQYSLVKEKSTEGKLIRDQFYVDIPKINLLVYVVKGILSNTELKEYFRFERKMYYAFNQMYLNNYQICPIERLAELESLFLIYQMSIETKDDGDIHLYIKDKIYSILLSGYMQNYRFLSPTIEFYKNCKQEKLLDTLSWKNLSVSERIFFGLPISIEEWDKLKRNKNNITLKLEKK